jgi:uncharacterized protein (DUF1501 family)
MEPISRRVFFRQGSFALVALGLPPSFLTRSFLAETRAAARKKTLICIFQRGAVDGLNMVVPFGEKAYYERRRTIAVRLPGQDAGAIDLDGFFGLHPSLGPLHDLWRRRELAIVHAVGSPHPTRSHFEAQDYMETAAPGSSSVRDGWLNRALTQTACDCDGRTLEDARAHAADHSAGQTAMALPPALRGIAMGSSMPVSLRGAHPALAAGDISRFGVAGGRDASLESTFERMHGGGGDLISAASGEAFDAIRVLRAANPAQYRAAAGVNYPAGEFGRSLSQIAQLIKSDIGVEIAFTDIGGWDTHQAQGAGQGQLARRFDELARGIRALHDDLGDRMEDVVVLTMSEFGRTVAENGSGGTDHGHANCILVMGGQANGGRILGDWPGLEREQLYEGRDLALTTDFRDVFGEIVSAHLGVDDTAPVFPGHAVDAARHRGVLRG